MISFFVDTHCHLDLFEGIQNNVLSEGNKPIKTISVTTAPQFFESNVKLFSTYPNIRTALGFHPQLATRYQDQFDLFKQHLPQTKYIGEIGLDGSSDLKDSFIVQKKIFNDILNEVKSSDYKVLTIHSRNAAKETLESLKILEGSKCKVILHWFSGGVKELNIAIERGYYFSINHKMTGTAKGMQLIGKIPESFLLTETDAPFTFNSLVKDRQMSLEQTLGSVAEMKAAKIEEIKALVYENFKNLLTQ